ncbi:MAG: HAMP domain-containing sensor histidine kinase [Bacillota bacterium]|nr:HAMP domain-containing sensor histidine kinase [Bacillota bacterium]
MFRTTHNRLTLINSLVFAILISILGGILYFYTQHRLYEDVNQSLIAAAHLPDQGNGDQVPRGRRFFHDPRIMVLLWQKDTLLLDRNPEAERFKTNEKKVLPKVLSKLTDIQIANYAYRYFAIKVDTGFGPITVQVIRNINSEKEFLDRLLMIIISACSFAILSAIASGYFLAGRALIPIKEAWAKQQQFVTDASHELRTPLAVIQAKTDILFRSPSASIEERILDISAISNESRRLSKLVSNLLTLARSDSNQIEMKKQTFQLDEMLAEITSHYEEISSYQEKEISLAIPAPVLFTADKERIHQLIVILLDNAIKFTTAGGKIGLSCYQSHSHIFVTVEDNGIGISEDEIPRIFDRFYQSDKARTISEGTGLGLSIAHWIIEKHHGKVFVSSQTGKGTKIEISFPKNQSKLT